jgi:hypothetical protein
VPAYSSSRVKTFIPGVWEPTAQAGSDTALHNFPATNVNVSSIAGQTVRLRKNNMQELRKSMSG